MQKQIAGNQHSVIRISLVRCFCSSYLFIVIFPFISFSAWSCTISFIGCLHFHIINESAVCFHDHPSMLSQEISLWLRKLQSQPLPVILSLYIECRIVLEISEWNAFHYFPVFCANEIESSAGTLLLVYRIRKICPCHLICYSPCIMESMLQCISIRHPAKLWFDHFPCIRMLGDTIAYQREGASVLGIFRYRFLFASSDDRYHHHDRYGDKEFFHEFLGRRNKKSEILFFDGYYFRSFTHSFR